MAVDLDYLPSMMIFYVADGKSWSLDARLLCRGIIQSTDDLSLVVLVDIAHGLLRCILLSL